MKQTKSEMLATCSKPVSSAKVIGNNTLRIEYADGSTAIRLHNTDVVTTLKNGHKVLNSGGWKTNTTKDRINTYANARISQKNSVWFMKDGTLFYDGIEINALGEVVGKVKQPDMKAVDAMKKRISKYVALITKNNLPVPDGGDCWDCAFKTADGKTMGDIGGHTDHLLNHMKEGYVVGSLLVNAMHEAGYRDEQIAVHYGMKLADTFKRAVRKYLVKRLIK